MSNESNWKVSYAQNREDILLARALPSSEGFYVDVGAADPVEFSVTKLFYDRGWSGINIEPQEEYFRKLVAERPRDTNLQFAITDQPGTMTFHVAPTHPGWATVNEAVARQMTEQGIQTVERKVRSVTLADVCALYVPGTIDFLKIDVEGAERNVLMGADFKRWRPRIVVIEATEQGGSTPNHDLWEDLILAEDYQFATFDGLNRYYVRSEDAELVHILQVPVNVFDQFAPFEHQSRIWELEFQARDFQKIAEEKGLEAAAARLEIEDLKARLAELEQAREALEAERNGAWVECENLRREIASLSMDCSRAMSRESDVRRRLEATRHRLHLLRGALNRSRLPACDSEPDRQNG